MSECVEVKCPDGIPAWVMTFADLMSLLLAFFVLLFSFSEVDKNIYKEMAGSLKQAFGVQREIKAKEPPKGINIIAREFSPGRPVPTPYDEVRQMTTDDYHSHPVFTDPADKGQENQDKKTNEADVKSHNALQENIQGEQAIKGMPVEQGKESQKIILDETQQNIVRNEEQLKEALAENKNKDVVTIVVDQPSKEELEMLKRLKEDGEAIRLALDKEIKNGLIDMEVKKPRVVLRIREKGSFPSGSAQVIGPFRAITNKISKVFSEFDGMIIVSGHTDNIPIHTHRFRSNWELSASRAVSVIHELSKNNLLKKKHFQIEAYADTRPLNTNKTSIGRAKNRRVEIILDYSQQRNPVKKDAVKNNKKAGNKISNKKETTNTLKWEKPINKKAGNNVSVNRPGKRR